MIRTSTTGLTVGRPAVEKSRVIAAISQRIIQGDFAPGDRLPTRREFCQVYDVSQITIQQVIDQLARDGFVESRGALGTFVTSHPPHLFHYAVVFPTHPNAVRANRFWTALANEATALHGIGGRKFRLWYGFDGRTDTEDYRALLGDVRRGRLAGIIYPTLPWLLENTPLLSADEVPLVTISPPNAQFSTLRYVSLDGQSFIEKAIDHLVSRARRRIAILIPPGDSMEQWKCGFAARNIEIPAHRIQIISNTAPDAARNCAHLLCRAGQSDRPDGLIIADDNLVEHATAGLIDAGVRVPDDLDVVAHCNFPYPTPSVVPSRRLGYDARRVLAACLQTIEQVRAGIFGAGPTVISATFEDEIRV